MEDLLQYQIHESCKLALPEGLKELMSDISREVLRAQPRDLYKFITEYLSSLLVTRENLSIAARVCEDVWDCHCYPELDDELKHIGLDEESASGAKEIIEKFFDKGQINESKLLIELVKKTNLSEEKLPAVLEAIRKAFLRHQRDRIQIYEVEPKQHTASYRAYRARIYQEREDPCKDLPVPDEQKAKHGHLVTSKVTFGAELESEKCPGREDQVLDRSAYLDEEIPPIGNFRLNPKSPAVAKISSTSLAGSYMSLPTYKPYSAHDFNCLSDLQEMPERERANFDYTRLKNEETNTERNIIASEMYRDTKEVKIDKNILTFELTDVEDMAIEAEDLSEASVEENVIDEDTEKNLPNYEIGNDLINEEWMDGEIQKEQIDEELERDPMTEEMRQIVEESEQSLLDEDMENNLIDDEIGMDLTDYNVEKKLAIVASVKDSMYKNEESQRNLIEEEIDYLVDKELMEENKDLIEEVEEQVRSELEDIP